ncbi:AI-2E family transporter [Paracoccus limosus]|jgi:predicted PurR-regulated permease PerM|uniref:AI-2E family transporter n=2 Tax=Paracoccus limosus TaxID=913252 RepID=A0A844H9A2_9RHOB|nr:AI-2E family transporter [Paracoccus limosus]MTH36313.1 AI-2E family transporter [Paracoccus limosus]
MFPVSERHQKPDLPRVANWAVVGIFLLLLFGFFAQARGFLMPVTLAILLFFVFIPFRRLMERIGIGAAATGAIVSVGLVVLVVVIGFAISGPVDRLIENAPQISTRLEQRFSELRSNFKGLERAAQKIDQLTSGGAAVDPGETTPTSPPTPSGTPETAGGLSGTVTGTVTSIPTPGAPAPSDQHIRVEVNAVQQGSAIASVMDLGPAFVGQIIFTLFMLFFLISSGDLLYLKIVQSFDRMRDKRAAYLALREIEDRLGAYLGAITLINACLGIAIGLAMWAWGLPSPILFGLAAFLLNYIPYLGPIAGVLISTLVALFVFDDLFGPLMVGLTYLTLTSIEGQLITPYFVSRKLQLNTVVVFLTVALWAWLWSVLGMIVAVPLLVVMRVLADHIPGLEKFGNFLAGEDPPALEDEDDDAARDPGQQSGNPPEIAPGGAVVADL